MRNIQQKSNNNKNEMIFIEKLIVYGIFIAISYQGIIPTTLLDEMLLVLLIFIEIFKYKSVSIPIKKEIKLLIVYFLSTIVTLLLRQYNLKIYIYEFMNSFKPIVILILFNMISICDKDKYKLTRNFILINIPSIVMGIIQFQNRELGYEIGKVRDGVARIQGASGHPITFGFIMMLIILILYDISKNKGKIIKTLIVFLQLGSISLLLATKSRLPLLLLGVVIYMIIILRASLYRRTLIIIVSFCALLLIVTKYYVNIQEYLADDITHTIRMYSIMQVPKILKVFPLFGTGIGTWGSASSIVYNSYVYSQFNIVNINSSQISNGNLFESGLAQKMIECGIIGTCIFYIIFIRYLSAFRKNSDYIGYSLIVIFIINSILNPIYLQPVVIMMSIYISANKNNPQNIKVKIGKA